MVFPDCFINELFSRNLFLSIMIKIVKAFI